MPDIIKFYGSQVGGAATKPHSYTGSPTQLLKHDLLTAFKFILYLPYIVWPLKPCGSDGLCELYPSPANLWAMFLHFILVLMQLPFILSIPIWFFFPVWWVVLCVVVFMLVNKAICFLLNGSKLEFPSNPKFDMGREEHHNEQWIFLNGVAVGSHWLQSNVDRLALTFGRPVLGVHNKTNGIIFDVIQCLVQRNLTYATSDVRGCYGIIKSTLYKSHLTKVIFVLHSQGGIEGGMILDWLLQEVPQDLLAKLEVYTFGNAANHFNNPHLHLISQNAATKNPDKPSTTKTITQVNYHEPTLPIDIDNINGNGASSIAVHSSTHRSKSSKQESTSGKTIRYIEHYAHTKDFVAQWGVLHFVPSSSTSAAVISADAPRFMGRVFERQGRGHQFIQHYLDNMFPLKRSLAADGGIAGTGFEGADEKGEFMGSILDLTPNTPLEVQEDEQREGVEMSYQAAHGETVDESELNGVEGVRDVLGRGFSPSTTFQGFQNGRGLTRGESLEIGEEGVYKVGDLSRLWLYVNGKSPKIDETDVSVARMATI